MLQTALITFVIALLLLMTPVPGKKCTPAFVKAGSSIGTLDGQPVLILDIDKERCWIEVEVEDSSERYWVGGTAVRYLSADESVDP